MKKTITIIILIILLILVGLWYVGSRESAEDRVTSPEENEGDTQNSQTSDLELRGVITKLDETQAMVDGPYIVEVAIEGGDDTARVLIPSMGILLCEARDNIADISGLEEGMTVEARGSVSVDDGGSITPCESEDHYLRVVSE